MHLGVVGLDRVGDLLQDRRLAGLGGRHDHPALTLADGREQIDDPGGQFRRPGRLEPKPLVGEQRREVLEPRAVPGFIGRKSAHGVDADERRELLVRRRGAARTFDEVTAAHGEAAGLADGDVDVFRTRQVSLGPQEPIPFVAQVEQAAHGDELAGVLGFLPASLKLALTTATATATAGRALAAAPASSPAIAGLIGIATLLHGLTVLVLASTLAWRVGHTIHRRAGPVAFRRGLITRGLTGGPLRGGVRRLCPGRVLILGSTRGGRGDRRSRGPGAAVGTFVSGPGPIAGIAVELDALGLTVGRRASARTTGPGGRGGAPVGAPGGTRRHLDPRGAQDLVDDVGLFAARIGVERHRLGDRPKLFAFFSFEYGPLELLLCSHQSPR